VVKDDPLIGPVTIAELKKTIAICSQTHNLNLQIIQNSNYTDGKTIYISAPPMDIELVKRWILMEALVIHESWHILFKSSFQLLTEFVKKYEDKFSKINPAISTIAHDIINIIEDSRIESLGKNRFLGVKNKILFNTVYWIKKRPSLKDLKDWKLFVEGILQISAIGGLLEPITDKKILQILEIANFYIQWVKVQENSMSTFLVGEKIMELLLKFFKIEGKYSKQTETHPKTDIIKNIPSNIPVALPNLPKNLQNQLNNLQKMDDNNDSSNNDSSNNDSSNNDSSNNDSSNNDLSNNNKTENKTDSNDKNFNDNEESNTIQPSIEFPKNNNFSINNKSINFDQEIIGDMELIANSELIGNISQDKLDNNSDLKQTLTSIQLDCEIPVIRPDDIDPIKSNLINLVDLRIKVDDLTKRNYLVEQDEEIKQLGYNVIKILQKSDSLEEVFLTSTYDIGIVISLDRYPNKSKKFKSLYNNLRPLIQITINQFKSLFKIGSNRVPHLKFGRLDSKAIVGGIINEDPHIFKKKIIEKGNDEIAIALLIDQSGSMGSKKIYNAQRAAILFGEVLNVLKIYFAIYGWTDMELSNKSIYLSNNLKVQIPYYPKYDMLNEELTTIFSYKDFDNDYNTCREKLGLVKSMENNADHNAIEFVSKKLIQTKKRVKILIVLSDGQPYAQSYKMLSYRLKKSGKYEPSNIGINLTRQTIEKFQKLGVQTLCISIDDQNNYQELIYGKSNYVLINPSNIIELPVKVARLLSIILRRSRIKI